MMQVKRSWKVEFAQFLSEGDGNRCPLYKNCTFRRSGHWCIDDNYEKIAPLYDFKCKSNEDYKLIKPVCDTKIFRYVQYFADDFIKLGGVLKPPVPSNLVFLADNRRSIEIRFVSLKSTYGALWCLPDAWIIHINSNLTRAMQRFALFHEAFHILAHTETTPVFKKRKIDQGRFNEMLADKFSGLVLMPPDWAVERWNETNNIEKMAKIFDISPKLVIFSLKMMGILK